MAKSSGNTVRPRGPGEWIVPEHALDAVRAAREIPRERRPLTPTEVVAEGLRTLLERPGPVLVLDGEEARAAWDALEADFSVKANSATATAMLVGLLRRQPEAGKLLLLDCTEEFALSPETILGRDMADLRLGILASPGTELSEAAAARCRVVRILPSPQLCP